MLSLQACQIEQVTLHEHYDSEQPPRRFMRIMHGAFERKMPIPTVAHFLVPGPVPREIKLDTSTGCTWTVVMKAEVIEAQPNPFTLMSLDEGWAVFKERHGYMPDCVGEFEFVHPGRMKVKIFQNRRHGDFLRQVCAFYCWSCMMKLFKTCCLVGMFLNNHVSSVDQCFVLGVLRFSPWANMS